MMTGNNIDSDHSVLRYVEERPGTPTKPLTPCKLKSMSSTSLNFLMTPTNVKHSVTSLTTLDTSDNVHFNEEHQSNDSNSHKSISSVIYQKNILNGGESYLKNLEPPMTPKTHMDALFLSPSPTLFSPKVNRRRSYNSNTIKTKPGSDEEGDLSNLNSKNSNFIPLGVTHNSPEEILLRDGEDNLFDASNERPIREISKHLKTRLNCELMNLQTGWFDKSLPELEGQFKERKHSRDFKEYNNNSRDDFFQAMMLKTEKRVHIHKDEDISSNDDSPNERVSFEFSRPYKASSRNHSPQRSPIFLKRKC